MDKAELRKKVRSDIRNIDKAYAEASNTGIFENITGLSEYKNAKNIFAYFSVKGEVDTLRLIKYAVTEGKNVYLPIVLGDGIMVFAKAVGEMVSGALYSIPEPDETAERAEPEAGDLMLVPALCFDKQGYRLGQGGGYYDRYLEKHSSVFTIGLCRAKMQMEAVPREEHDMAVDMVVTEHMFSYEIVVESK